MSAKSKDNLDWWSNGSGANPPKREGAKPKPPKKSGAKRSMPLFVRLLINVVIIGLMVVLGSVAAHYILLSITRHGEQMSVPKFEFMSIYDAQRLAEERGLNLIISDSVYAPRYEGGLVLEQNPAPEVMVKSGRSIYVTINALNREMVVVPYVAGRSLRQAKNMLEVAGLTIDKLVYEPDLATNYVLSQSFEEKTISKRDSLLAPRGSGVVLNVGVNQADNSVVVPQLIGMSLYEARSILQLSGLNIGEVSRTSEGDMDNEKLAMVMSQSIAADSNRELGDYVSFAITTERELVDSALKEMEEAHLLEQQMLAEEQASLDSINRASGEFGLDKEETKLPEGGSGFKDLFD